MTNVSQCLCLGRKRKWRLRSNWKNLSVRSVLRNTATLEFYFVDTHFAGRALRLWELSSVHYAGNWSLCLEMVSAICQKTSSLSTSCKSCRELRAPVKFVAMRKEWRQSFASNANRNCARLVKIITRNSRWLVDTEQLNCTQDATSMNITANMLRPREHQTMKTAWIVEMLKQTVEIQSAPFPSRRLRQTWNSFWRHHHLSTLVKPMAHQQQQHTVFGTVRWLMAHQHLKLQQVNIILQHLTARVHLPSTTSLRSCRSSKSSACVSRNQVNWIRFFPNDSLSSLWTSDNLCTVEMQILHSLSIVVWKCLIRQQAVSARFYYCPAKMSIVYCVS